MAFSSLRTRIIALLACTMLAVAAFVIFVGKRDVTMSVAELERHSVHNTVSLIDRDVEARWNALLGAKISTVRRERERLIETGALVLAELASWQEMAEAGRLTHAEAQQAAKDWINRRTFENERFLLAYDGKNDVIASSDARLRGSNISTTRNFKGHMLAGPMREEVKIEGHCFAVYNSALLQGVHNQRYGYFGYFRPWNWVVVVSDSANDITERVEEQRLRMEEEMRETLSQLTLSRNGFMFVLDGDGREVVAPPTHAPKFDEEFRQHLRERLEENRSPQTPTGTFEFSGDGVDWFVEYAWSKPLGWTLVAMVPKEDFAAPADKLVGKQTLIFVLGVLAALACAMLLASGLMRPLTRLAQFVRRLPDQDLTVQAEIPPAIARLAETRRDEVGMLAAAFMSMDRKLRENIAQLVRETTAHERIESELNIARAIQLGLLPLPLDADALAAVNLYALMQPAKEVGGDLYDYFMISERELCLAIGDVSGKGVPAALFMAITRTLIRAAAGEFSNPEGIVGRVNQRLAENNPNIMFVTLLVGVLNLESGELRWVNAGHPPPLLVTAAGEATVLAGRGGPACGVALEATYKSRAVTLAKGDMLIGYTDGVTEAMTGAGEQYGLPRLLAVLAHPDGEVEGEVRRVLADIESFTAGEEPSDDITMIAVRRV
jgi:sigma-B regulation protein RsbU (phosphoserine phosphatase)